MSSTINRVHFVSFTLNSTNMFAKETTLKAVCRKYDNYRFKFLLQGKEGQWKTIQEYFQNQLLLDREYILSWLFLGERNENDPLTALQANELEGFITELPNYYATKHC